MWKAVTDWLSDKVTPLDSCVPIGHCSYKMNRHSQGANYRSQNAKCSRFSIWWVHLRRLSSTLMCKCWYQNSHAMKRKLCWESVLQTSWFTPTFDGYVSRVACVGVASMWSSSGERERRLTRSGLTGVGDRSRKGISSYAETTQQWQSAACGELPCNSCGKFQWLLRVAAVWFRSKVQSPVTC